MKQKVCYRLDDLMKMLPDFKLVASKVIHESEDDSSAGTEYRLSNREDIKLIKVFHGWGTSLTVEYENGEKFDFYGDNLTIYGRKINRINSNSIISPRLYMGGNFVESREDLDKWLKYQGITEEQLEAISEATTVYEIIEYIGVPTPSKSSHGNYWGYSSENLKLDEREITQVLDSIEDEVLREKIKCILHARVFKRNY